MGTTQSAPQRGPAPHRGPYAVQAVPVATGNVVPQVEQLVASDGAILTYSQHTLKYKNFIGTPIKIPNIIVDQCDASNDQIAWTTGPGANAYVCNVPVSYTHLTLPTKRIV